MPDLARMFGDLGTMFGLYVLVMVGTSILYTAALRAVVRPDDSSFAYLRLGLDEVRIVLVGLVVFVAFALLYFVLALVLGLVLGLAAAGSSSAAILVIIVSVVAIVALLSFLYIRFSLAFALTVLRRKVVIGEAWSLSRGRFWMLFGAFFVIGLIVFALFSVVFAINAGSYLAEVGRASLDPGAMRAAQQHQMQSQFGAVTGMTVFGWALGAVAGVVWMTLNAGATGVAALGLLDDRFADVGAIYE